MKKQIPPTPLGQYDGFEVHPLILLEDGKGYETCDRNDPKLFCWGVYGHTPNMGIVSLADCATEEEAEALASLFRQHQELLTVSDYDDDMRNWNDCDQYHILNPDGLPWLETESNSDQGAWDLFESEVLPKYQRQGYYGTARGERIPLDELRKRCQCEQFEGE